MIIKIPSKQISLLLTFSIGLFSPMLAWGATTPSLGAAATYGVLSSTYTNTTITTINGDVGFTTPPAVAPLGNHPFYGLSIPYSTAGTDQGVALSALNAQGCDFNFGGATDLSLLPQPLIPGVYCINAAASVGTAGITLSGAGTYIFRIDGTLNSDANAEVVLTGGASACDVFWTPVGATTLGANTLFQGTVIDDAGITVGANTIWQGRALAFGETVTTDTTTISNVCIASPATLQIIKLVDNTSGGSSVSSDFTFNILLSGDHVLGSPASGDTLGTTYALYADTYLVTENTSASYSTSFSGDCSLTGLVVLLPGDDLTCIITNTFVPVVSAGGLPSSIGIDNCPDGDDSGNSNDGLCVATIGSILPNTTPPTTPPTTIPPVESRINHPSRKNDTPQNVMEPYVFGVTPIQDEVVLGTVTLPAQLPNSGASASTSNTILKVIALAVAVLLASTLYGIELKNRLVKGKRTISDYEIGLSN